MGSQLFINNSNTTMGDYLYISSRRTNLERGIMLSKDRTDLLVASIAIYDDFLIIVELVCAQKILKSCRSRDSWGPTDPETKREWLGQSLLEEPEGESKTTTPTNKGECKLKKEVVAKLSQTEGKGKNQVNGWSIIHVMIILKRSPNSLANFLFHFRFIIQSQ